MRFRFPFRRDNRRPDGFWDAPDADDDNIKGTSVDPYDPVWPRWKKAPPDHGEGEFISEEPFFEIDEIRQRAEFYPPGRRLVDKNFGGNPASRQRVGDMPSGNLSRRRLLVARGSEEMGTLKPMVFAQTTTAEPDSPRQATSDAQSTQSDAVDEASIDQIIDLLNDDSDAVRGKVAMAIAAIGPRARRATPALEDALELARQYITFAAARNFIFSGFPIYTGPSSAHDICHAFKEIGAPEPPDCFNGYYDPVTSNNGP